MKSLFFLITLFSMLGTLHAAWNDTMINLYVKASIAIPEAQLQQGTVRCQYEFLNSPYLKKEEQEPFQARGSDLQSAQNNLVMKCIKETCKTIGKQMAQSVRKMISNKEQDIRDLMEVNGYQEADIQNFLKERKNPSTVAALENLTCETAVESASFWAFRSCAWAPATCETLN